MHYSADQFTFFGSIDGNKLHMLVANQSSGRVECENRNCEEQELNRLGGKLYGKQKKSRGRWKQH